MLEYIVYIIIAGLLAMVIHETAHAVLALILTGKLLSFEYAYGMLWNIIPVPRFIWYMPKTSSWKQKIIAAAGFTGEFISIYGFMIFNERFALVYACITLTHLLLYSSYAGESSDFKWF